MQSIYEGDRAFYDQHILYKFMGITRHAQQEEIADLFRNELVVKEKFVNKQAQYLQVFKKRQQKVERDVNASLVKQQQEELEDFEMRQQNALRRLCQHAAASVALLVGTVWFSEVGRPVPARGDDNCLRLYHRSTCLQEHHGFFMRGCVLAVFALLCTDAGQPERLARELHLASALLPAMAFCWPLCIAVKLLLDITFGAALVNQNRPVVFVMCAAALGVLALWYVSIVQPCLAACVSCALRPRATGQAPPPDSPRTPLV